MDNFYAMRARKEEVGCVVIGDVHGKVDKYKEIVDECNERGCPTVQIGDMGFKESYQQVVDLGIDPEMNKFFGGNHDDYDSIDMLKDYNLGNYGTRTVGKVEFFFMRGAYSIDKHLRLPRISWWEAEELTYREGHNVLAAYIEAKPSIMLTHDCPEVMYQHMLGNPNLIYRGRGTTTLLQACWEAHKPDLWIFGHHHKNKRMAEKGTVFQCLDELSITRIGGFI